MMNMLRRFINNKYFYLWSIIIILVLYMFYGFFHASVANYMLWNQIEDNEMYIFYVYTLPMAFSNVNYMFCILLDVLYMTILLYPSVSFVDYFFNENSTTTTTRISRNRWIDEFISVNLLCSVLISAIYILLYYILGNIHDYEIILQFASLNNFLPIIYKTIISCIVPITYIYAYIKTDNAGLSLGFSIFVNIILQIIIKISFDVKKLYFGNSIYTILIFIVLYLLLRSLSIKSFKRRDI